MPMCYWQSSIGISKLMSEISSCTVVFHNTERQREAYWIIKLVCGSD